MSYNKFTDSLLERMAALPHSTFIGVTTEQRSLW